MAQPKVVSEPTLLPVWRADGTVYFEVETPLSERLCHWAVLLLWLSVLGVAVGVLLWR
jgi:hypothetical protein